MPRAARFLTLSLLLLISARIAAQAPQVPANPTAPSTPSTGTTPPAAATDKPFPSVPPPLTKYVPPTEIQGQSLDVWIKRLDSRDAGMREQAVRTIPLFGEPAKKAIDKLIEMMNDPDFTVKVAAMQVVTMNPIDDIKQQRIAKHIKDPLIVHSQAAIRYQAMLAASRLGPAAYEIIPVLIDDSHLHNVNSFEARMAAAEALGQVARADPKNPARQSPDPRAVKALLYSLKDPALAVRVEVVRSLMYLGVLTDPKEVALVALEKKLIGDRLIEESDPVLRLWLRVCLMRLDARLITETNLNPIASALNSTEQRVRLNAAEALAYMGADAKSKIGDLRVGLKFDKSQKPEDLEFLAKCLWALGQIGPEASFVAPEMEKLAAEHPNETIKAYARDTLNRVRGIKLKD